MKKGGREKGGCICSDETSKEFSNTKKGEKKRRKKKKRKGILKTQKAVFRGPLGVFLLGTDKGGGSEGSDKSKKVPKGRTREQSCR